MRTDEEEGRGGGENASSHWWEEGVRTQQLGNVRVSQASAAPRFLYCHGNAQARLHATHHAQAQILGEN